MGLGEFADQNCRIPFNMFSEASKIRTTQVHVSGWKLRIPHPWDSAVPNA